VTEQHGVLYANQWDNLANRDSHLHGTGPEIWDSTAGRVDGFTCAVGTGGTLAGVGSFLKEKNPNCVIAASDPLGAAVYSWVKTGELGASGSSITEGIGQGRVTGNLGAATIDDAFQIPDTEMLPVVYDLLQHEGLLMGGSTGINVAGAIRLARELGPGKTIVTILCDSGSRYQSKLFNPEFLKSKGLPLPPWLVD
jgi:cysteine synthase A